MRLQIGKTLIMAAGTGYAVQIPRGTVAFKLRCRDGTAFVVATSQHEAAEGTERVWSVQLNDEFEERGIQITEPTTIFVAGTAGKTIESLFWIEEVEVPHVA